MALVLAVRVWARGAGFANPGRFPCKQNHVVQGSGSPSWDREVASTGRRQDHFVVRAQLVLLKTGQE